MVRGPASNLRTKQLEQGFYFACADLASAKRFVVYPGSERFPLGAETEVVNVAELGNLLQAIKQVPSKDRPSQTLG